MEHSYRNLGYVLLVLLPIFVAGFWIPYFSEIPHFDETITTAVHVHFASLFCFLLLLIVQPLAIRYKAFSTHRVLGKFSNILIPIALVSSVAMLWKEYHEHLGVHYVVSSVMPTSTDLSKDDDLKHGNPKAIMQMFNNRTADDFKRMAAQANEIGESAKKRGLEFAYHNHNVEFRKIEGGTTGYKILQNETDPTLVKLEVDAGWMAVGGADPAALIAANASRVKLMHFKDFSAITPPINELGGQAEAHIVDLGTGVAPLKAAYKAARKAGTKFFIVDHDPPFHGKTALQTAKVDYAYAAGLMGRRAGSVTAAAVTSLVHAVVDTHSSSQESLPT